MKSKKHDNAYYSRQQQRIVYFSAMGPDHARAT